MLRRVIPIEKDAAFEKYRTCTCTPSHNYTVPCVGTWQVAISGSCGDLELWVHLRKATRGQQ